jgi:hypothetical protein
MHANTVNLWKRTLNGCAKMTWNLINIYIHCIKYRSHKYPYVLYETITWLIFNQNEKIIHDFMHFNVYY